MKKQVKLYLDEKLYTDIKQHAVYFEISYSKLVEEALKDWLNSNSIDTKFIKKHKKFNKND